MRPLSSAELLNAWERGRAQQPVERALTLLSTALPEKTPDELARLGIGQRDAYLLNLREWIFGPKLTTVVRCSTCQESLELNFDAADVRTESQCELGEALSLTVADYEVRFRVPNSEDLMMIGAQTHILASRQRLLKRCLLDVRRQGEDESVDDLPADVAAAVVDQIAQADSQADVVIRISCPLCGHEWLALFDIVSFFWSEINAWAYRILREVHSLARAYGWREADILAMNPWRRQFYLQMVTT